MIYNERCIKFTLYRLKKAKDLVCWLLTTLETLSYISNARLMEGMSFGWISSDISQQNHASLSQFRRHHHLSLFGHNTSEMTNMSGCEETKRSALGVGTPLELNRLEMSTFSGVNCSYHQFDHFDHFFSVRFDRFLEREDTSWQPSRNVEKN